MLLARIKKAVTAVTVVLVLWERLLVQVQNLPKMQPQVVLAELAELVKALVVTVTMVTMVKNIQS